jgi:hypothetical protein
LVELFILQPFRSQRFTVECPPEPGVGVAEAIGFVGLLDIGEDRLGSRGWLFQIAALSLRSDIVLGGILSIAGEFLLPVVGRELAKRSMLAVRRVTPVVPAQIGSDAAAMGGIAKIFQSVLAHPVS